MRSTGSSGSAMRTKRGRATLFALMAAALYALSAPLSKLLLGRVAPTMMAAFLYLGAGAGMGAMRVAGRAAGRRVRERSLGRADLPYLIGMLVLDIAAPILLMIGLERTTAANAALLNNFEIVATSVIALALFGEEISRRLWLAIGLVTLSSMLLSFEDMRSLSFSFGSVFVLLACVCWGFENNCTRRLSDGDPGQIVTIKGLGSGAGSLVIALAVGEALPDAGAALSALLVGFVSYGLSIYCYIYAQRDLSAARTSAYYAAAPFISAALSLALFREPPSALFVVSFAAMAAGAYLAAGPAE